MNVITHKGIEVFQRNKIRNAIIAAAIQIDMPNFDLIDDIVNSIEEDLMNEEEQNIPVETIENLVISHLYRRAPQVARAFSSYKIDKEKARENPSPIEEVLYVSSNIAHENANKNPELVHIKSAYLAEIPSREFMREQLPKDCLEAHDKGIVYFHDSAYSARDQTNCCLFNLEGIFEGCEINNVWIETPKSFLTACTVATQALSMATNLQYGGITINLLHLAKFVNISRLKIRKQLLEELPSVYGANPQLLDTITQTRLEKEINQGMQTFLYQNNTLCAGTGQAAFLSISVWLNEDPTYTQDLILVFTKMLRQRIQGIKQKNGFYSNPNFPKILYVLDETTMKGGKYYEVTKLCAECSAKRLVPDYMSLKKHLELKGIFTPSMGCRSLLSPWTNEHGELQVWGRCNMGVQTLNLPYIAMENNPQHSLEVFWNNLHHYLGIAYRDMLWRANHVAKIKAKEAPLFWQWGGLLKLNPEDALEPYVYNGYMTMSLGITGLYECTKYLTGENQFEGVGNSVAHAIMTVLNNSNEEFRKNTGIAAGIYGTPMETATDTFAKACLRDFGQVGDGTQRQFLTNSYHHYVGDKVDAFTKLIDEEQFSDKCLGGSISYVEVPNLSNNIDAVLELIECIGNECLYGEINSEISTCTSCGFNGYDFPKIQANDGTVRWKCPCCGETNPEKVKTSYRVCGYISNYTPNAGRSEDIINRVKHLN